MFQRFSRISAVRGIMDRRILANYRLEARAAAAQLPAPFRPKLIQGEAIGGLCLIRLKKVRPALLPLAVGIGSENAAHRIAVLWDDNGQEREGVYIPRRDTDSRLNALAGGRLFPGRHHHARFEVQETHDRFEVGFRSDDGDCSMHLRAQLARAFPAGSVFGGLDAASRFFQAGSLGYSATSSEHRFDGLELNCKQWTMQPLEVEAIRSSFFDDPARFPAGTVSLDCALLMRSIDHIWHQRGSMCCSPAARAEAGHG